MKFYTIDTSYIQELHNVDPEVFYESFNYDNKPYIGIVVLNGKYNYFIPLTSAKPRHLKWRNTSKFNYIIYELLPLGTLMPPNAIYVQTTNNIKHILSVLEIRKMIPVPIEYCTYIDFNNIQDLNYRNLLIKEYNFLKPLQLAITQKASFIYANQKDSGTVYDFHCDYSKLEKVYDKHVSLIQSQQPTAQPTPPQIS